MPTHDVVVVGAGPGGSTTARHLAKEGIDVLMLERERFPRDKPCGGLGTLGLRGLVGEALDDVIEQRCTRTRFFLNMQPLLEYDDPDLLFKRVRFDMLLVDLAVEEGASLREGARVVNVDNGPDGHAEVHLAGGEVIKARAVVGADGPYSVVARSTGLSRPLHDRRGNFAIYVEDEMPGSEVDAILGPPEDCRRHSYFFVGLTGMGWVFRKKGGLNVGIGVGGMGRSDVGKRAKRLLDDLGLGHLKDELHGHHIPGEFLPHIVADRVLLVGDAAGAGNPTTGCGIEDAMKTGIHASKVLVDLQRRGLDPTFSRLRSYESSLATMRRLQHMKGGALDLVNRLQKRGLATKHWTTLSLRTLVRFGLERFIWSDATRL